MERSHEWKDSVWQFKVSRVELSNLLKTRKRKFEVQINEEVLKRQKLENMIIQNSLKNRLNLRKK